MRQAADFDEIDQQIEELQAKLDGCRQAMVLSRAAIVVAGSVIALVSTFVGSYRTPMVVFSAFAAMIGGTVWLGASKTSLEEARDRLATLEATKNRMIDRVAAENGWRDMTSTVH